MVEDSKNDYVVFTNHYDKQATFPEYKNIKVVQLKYIPIERDFLSTIKAALTIVFQQINLTKFDALIVHSEGFGDLITLRNKAKVNLCYCHTPLRPVFDDHYKKRSIEKYNLIGKLLYNFLSLFFKKVDQKIWQKYDYIFLNSNESLGRAVKGGLLDNIPKNKYKILNPGTNKVNFISNIYKHYFLLPGRIMWTKNIELAIKSFIKFKSRSSSDKNFKLIIAGYVDKKSEAYLSKLKEIASNSKDVYFVINPTDKDLADLYSKAWAVVSTAFNEDWGITLLEANAHGKPTIAINRGGPTESQLNGVTGYLVKDSTSAVATALKKISYLNLETKMMRANSLANSKKYSSKNFRRQLNKVISELTYS